jgi:hypothetical protein
MIKHVLLIVPPPASRPTTARPHVQTHSLSFPTSLARLRIKSLVGGIGRYYRGGDDTMMTPIKDESERGGNIVHCLQSFNNVSFFYLDHI